MPLWECRTCCVMTPCSHDGSLLNKGLREFMDRDKLPFSSTSMSTGQCTYLQVMVAGALLRGNLR